MKPESTTQQADALARAQGCLLGQFAGDALGSLVEFRSPAEIQRQYGQGPERLVDGGVWNTLAGQPTDDSEMALALARSLVAQGRYSVEAAANAYVEWFKSGPFDIGMATRTALQPASKARDGGGSAAEAAAKHALKETQANGALMRISPLGIFGAGLDEEQVFDCAWKDAGLSHPHEVCRAASALYACAIAFAIRQPSVGAEEVVAYAVEVARKRHAPDAVAERLERAKGAPPENFLSQQGWVLIAFQNAFYRLLHAGTLQEGIVDTVRAGGDTDTNGAIAGALLGATHGRDAVPLQWRQSILSCRPLAGASGVHRPRPPHFWPVDALELAERLLAAGFSQAASG